MKFTIKSDDYKNFATGDVTNNRSTVSVAYSNAKTGANERVSYLITDSTKQIVRYYGSQKAEKESGTIEIPFPENMVSTDRLFVFNEQVNGDYKTDYASELKEVKIPEYVPSVDKTLELKIGDCVTFGEYDGSDLVWQCTSFEKITGYENDGTPITDPLQTTDTYADGYLPMMIATKIISRRPFDASGTVAGGSHDRDSRRGSYGSNFWGDSNIRCWLNSADDTVDWTCGNIPDDAHIYANNSGQYCNEAGFLTHFTDIEKSLIKPVSRNVLLGSADSALAQHGSSCIPSVTLDTVSSYYADAYSIHLTDKVFIMDIQQMSNLKKYLGKAPAGGFTPYSSYELTSTPSNVGVTALMNITTSGSIAHYNAYDGNASIRPAIYFNSIEAKWSGNGSAENPYKLEK